MSLRAAIASNGRRLRIPASDVASRSPARTATAGSSRRLLQVAASGNLVQPIGSLTFLYVSVQSTGITWAECASRDRRSERRRQSGP